MMSPRHLLSFADWSLRAKLTALFSLVLAGVTLLVMLQLPARLNEVVRTEFEQNAQTFTSFLAVIITPGIDFDDERYIKEQFDHLRVVDTAQYAAVQREDGSWLATWPTDSPPKVKTPGLDYENSVLRVSRPVETRSGAKASLYIGFSLEAYQRASQANQRFAWAVATIFLAVGLVAVWLIGTVLVRSIRNLTDTADLVAASDVATESLQFEDQEDWQRSNDEVRRLTWSINAIFRKIADQMEQLEDERIKALDAERRAWSAARARTDFVANMSHELRTPLNAILGFSELMMELSNEEDRVNTEAQYINQAGRHLLSLVNDVLDFAKLDAGRVEIESIEFDLYAVFQQCLQLVKEQSSSKGVELRYDITPEVPRCVVGDPLRLRQVLTNLLSNAVKFTEEGYVALRAQILRAGDPTHLRIEVVDTGIGIEPARIPELFQAFSQADTSTTRRYGGTGLGLAIVRELVELMDGDIGATSELGNGSTFWFTVGVYLGSGSALEVEQASITKRAHLECPSVLVVEDNHFNQLVMHEMLASLGCEVTIVEDGRRAVQALEGGSWDLVLMDWQMPTMDGLEATRIIRSREKADQRIPIIALTAHVRPVDRQRCLQVGMDDFLPKPVMLADLSEIIRLWAPTGA